jgi:uncharacterized protein YbbK (DUF523 family)
MGEAIKIGISSCLLGEKVRYDGGHKLDRFLRDILGQYVEYVPVCPEVECGLPIPRSRMQLTGDPEAPRLKTAETDIDLTDRLTEWAKHKVTELASEKMDGFIFKSKSPSCSLKGVVVSNDLGQVASYGMGIFARVFCEKFPDLLLRDEKQLRDEPSREDFIAIIRSKTH